MVILGGLPGELVVVTDLDADDRDVMDQAQMLSASHVGGLTLWAYARAEVSSTSVIHRRLADRRALLSQATVEYTLVPAGAEAVLPVLVADRARGASLLVVGGGAGHGEVASAIADLATCSVLVARRGSTSGPVLVAAGPGLGSFPEVEVGATWAAHRSVRALVVYAPIERSESPARTRRAEAGDLSRRAAEAVLSSLVTETTLRPRGAELSRALTALVNDESSWMQAAILVVGVVADGSLSPAASALVRLLPCSVFVHRATASGAPGHATRRV